MQSFLAKCRNFVAQSNDFLNISSEINRKQFEKKCTVYVHVKMFPRKYKQQKERLFYLQKFCSHRETKNIAVARKWNINMLIENKMTTPETIAPVLQNASSSLFFWASIARKEETNMPMKRRLKRQMYHASHVFFVSSQNKHSFRVGGFTKVKNL